MDPSDKSEPITLTAGGFGGHILVRDAVVGPVIQLSWKTTADPAHYETSAVYASR